MVDTETVKALVLRAQDGDNDAFNELYNLSCPVLRAAGMRILHNPDDVNEMIQETYLKIHRSFIGDDVAPIREPEKFISWATTIMKNLCKNLIASRDRKPEELRPETSDEDQAGMDVFDDSDESRDFSPEDAIELKYVCSLLEQEMSHVSPDRQTCFLLHQQGLTYREIAEQMNLPEGTVKSHVRYFRQLMQKKIKKIEKEEGIQLHGVVPLPLPNGTIRYLAELEPRKPAHWIAAEQNGKPTEKAKAPKTGIGRRVLWISLSVVLVASITAFSILHSTHQTDLSKPETTDITATDINGRKIRRTTTKLNPQNTPLNNNIASDGSNNVSGNISESSITVETKEGVYSSSATTIVRQASPDGTRSDYKDYRGPSGKYAVQNGKVIAYVQEMINDDSFGFYADIRIINGTGKTIKLEDITQLAIYSDDGLICSGPKSAGYAVGKTISPNGQCFIGYVRFNNTHVNRNFTTGMLRVESTITYTYA